MSPTSVTCPQCQATLKLPPALPVGWKAKCPRCSLPLVLPAGGELDEEDAPALNRAAVLSIVAGSALAVVVLTGWLLAVCLTGEPEHQEVALATEDPFETAPVAVRPKAAAPERKAPPPPKSLIALTPEEETRVSAATARGVEYLKRNQITQGAEAGTWPCQGGYPTGYAALAALTLLEAETPVNDPVIQRAARYVRKLDKHQLPGLETYQVALAILFLTRLNDPNDKDIIRSLAMRLVASQYPAGGWEYSSPPLAPQDEEELRLALRDYPANIGRSKLTQRPGMQFGILRQQIEGDPNFWHGGGDNSNTQFALLALWAARRLDVPVDPGLRLAVKRFRKTQLQDGSWAYANHRAVSTYPTMTAAGLLALAIGFGLENDLKETTLSEDAVLQKGFRRLAAQIGEGGGDNENFSKRPRQKFGPKSAAEMYFLWSVERVGVLYQLPKIEGKDWYRWGLEIIEANQKQDGHWLTGQGPGSSDLVDTCFALLFLHRANLAKDLTDKIQAMAAMLGRSQQKD